MALLYLKVMEIPYLGYKAASWTSYFSILSHHKLLPLQTDLAPHLILSQIYIAPAGA